MTSKINRKRKPKARTIAIGMRVPVDIVRELDSMRLQSNGIEISRTQIMLAAIMRGLTELRKHRC